MLCYMSQKAYIIAEIFYVLCCHKKHIFLVKFPHTLNVDRFVIRNKMDQRDEGREGHRSKVTFTNARKAVWNLNRSEACASC